MKATVIYLLFCVLALAFARESQVSMLEELLDHATLGQKTRETAFKRLSGKPVLDALAKMRVQLGKDKKKAQEEFEQSEELRLDAKEKAEKELAEADSSLEKVKRANEKSKKADEKAHKAGMDLLNDDRNVIKKMKENLDLLKKYKIPAGRIEGELAKIKTALLNKESELKETLKKQNEERKRLRTVAENALKRERKELKATLADNKRTKALDKKKLADNIAEIKEENELITKIEKIVTGKDEEERKEAERKAREAAKKAREAAERRRIEKEKREAEAARRKAEAAARLRAKKRANCKDAKETFRKMSTSQAIKEYRKPWKTFLGGAVVKNDCDKKTFRDENKRKIKQHAARVKMQRQKNCDAGMKKFQDMNFAQSTSEWKKPWRTFMSGVVPKNGCSKTAFRKKMEQKKKDHAEYVKIQKAKNCEKARDTFRKMTPSAGIREYRKPWKTFLSGAVENNDCDKKFFRDERKKKGKQHAANVEARRKRTCESAYASFKRMSYSQAKNEYRKSWSTFLGGAVHHHKCDKNRWRREMSAKTSAHKAAVERRRQNTCNNVFNSFKRMSYHKAKKEYRKSWSRFLGGAVHNHKCNKQRWRNEMNSKTRAHQAAVERSRKNRCNSAYNYYNRMSYSRSMSEYRKPWRTFLGGAVENNRCDKNRWRSLYKSKKRNHQAHMRRTYVHYNSRVGFRSYHNRYLVAESNGHLNANRPWLKQWETFRPQKSGRTSYTGPMRFGDLVGFRTYHNRYMVAESNGLANANRPWMRSWEKFRIYNKDNPRDRGYIRWNSRIGLRGAHGKYIVAENNGLCNANRHWLKGWETFTIQKSRY